MGWGVSWQNGGTRLYRHELRILVVYTPTEASGYNTVIVSTFQQPVTDLATLATCFDKRVRMTIIEDQTHLNEVISVHYTNDDSLRFVFARDVGATEYEIDYYNIELNYELVFTDNVTIA